MHVDLEVEAMIGDGGFWRIAFTVDCHFLSYEEVLFWLAVDNYGLHQIL